MNEKRFLWTITRKNEQTRQEIKNNRRKMNKKFKSKMSKLQK